MGVSLALAGAIPADDLLYGVKITPALIVKTIASIILSLLGMYYLNVGRNERAVGPMLKGAALVLLSLLIF